MLKRSLFAGYIHLVTKQWSMVFLYSYVRLVVQITHERRKERIGLRTITIRAGVITTHLYRLTSGWHWPTNSGVPKMFLKSLPKSILWARPKSMILMRGWGILRFNSMMFSGWERWEQRKNWRENAKERIRRTNDRYRTKTQQEWERDREREQEICHNTWKSHAKLQKCSLESAGILMPASNRSLPGHSIETILPSVGFIHARTNLLKAPMTSKYLTEMLCGWLLRKQWI